MTPIDGYTCDKCGSRRNSFEQLFAHKCGCTGKSSIDGLTREQMEQYFRIKNIVKQRENIVPRNYQTIGGMWTVDTYKLGDVTVQIMDEGYSARLFTNPSELDVVESYHNGSTQLEFRAGNADDIAALLAVMDT